MRGSCRAGGRPAASWRRARRLAKSRAGSRRVAERLNSGVTQGGAYLYGERPLPEPVLRELPRAIVTRNSYGALVLNTDRMMFVDVDRKSAPKSAGGFFGSLFGKPAPTGPDPAIEAMKTVVD